MVLLLDRQSDGKGRAAGTAVGEKGTLIRRAGHQSYDHRAVSLHEDRRSHRGCCP